MFTDIGRKDDLHSVFSDDVVIHHINNSVEATPLCSARPSGVRGGFTSTLVLDVMFDRSLRYLADRCGEVSI